jgi:hypothetical protein
MSIQALQMRVAERPSQVGGPTASAGAAAAGSRVAASQVVQDQVQVSDQARKLSAALATAEVELQLSPAKLREMLDAGTPIPGGDTE